MRPRKARGNERAYLDKFLPSWNTDSRTAGLRGDYKIPFGPPAPPVRLHVTEASDDFPIREVTEEERAEREAELREHRKYVATHWTRHDVQSEWMRRIRQMRHPSQLRVEDFGPMPQVGDPKSA